ncbi:hypothetical protein CXB51_005081 [Gossypium anomalum]|uniref:Reverse transcriptase Ty1/copia-type domain-containing protein n=1 Tax=Gossypium anomalum TaxID=47600 RepID=A0A8J5ZBS2_9ROSI|nr:hypothetical protein CXB51_005081 [Gossypium anomalum]
MSTAAPTPTPMVSFPKLVAEYSSSPLTDAHLYRSTIGMLQYVCITRLDLSYCVNKLSQYMNAPSEAHWKAVKRVLRYLSGTITQGLLYSKGQFQLSCYSNADWASSVEDRRATTGYVIYLGSNPIACLLAEIGVTLCQSPVVWCDNTSTVSMAANPTHHAKVKHVEIDHHFVREKFLMAPCKSTSFPPRNRLLMFSLSPSHLRCLTSSDKTFVCYPEMLFFLSKQTIQQRETRRMLV